MVDVVRGKRRAEETEELIGENAEELADYLDEFDEEIIEKILENL